MHAILKTTFAVTALAVAGFGPRSAEAALTPNLEQAEKPSLAQLAETAEALGYAAEETNIVTFQEARFRGRGRGFRGRGFRGRGFRGRGFRGRGFHRGFRSGFRSRGFHRGFGFRGHKFGRGFHGKSFHGKGGKGVYHKSIFLGIY